MIFHNSTYMINSKKRCRFSEKCSNSYKKCEKVTKLQRNSEKLYIKILKNYIKNFEKNFHQDNQLENIISR